MTPLAWLLIGPVCAVAAFQLYYVVRSLRVRIRTDAWPAAPAGDGVAILIPVFNAAATLGGCLESILRNDPVHLRRVVVVLDHCTDASAAVVRSYVSRFAGHGVPLDILALPETCTGKVAAILFGGRHLGTDDVLLLDADIVLEDTALAELLGFHRASGGPYTSCLVFPHQPADAARTLTAHIVNNNRLYRQGVVQAVKNRSGVANFPGGVQLVDFPRYRRLLVDGFLEDLTATYRVLAEGGRVAVLPRVLAYEVERSTLRSLFLQRVRWTIGAIQHVPTQVRTARLQRTLHAKVLVNSYHVMWEFQHYVLVAGALAAPFAGPAAAVLLVPFALYALQIGRSAAIGRAHYRNSVAGAVAHCLVFPAVITAALAGSLALLVWKQRFFFRTELLYRRS